MSRHPLWARSYYERANCRPPPIPPTDHARERPYHRLVRRIFEDYGQGNWKECAKEAAKRLHEVGRQRQLRTARPGRPRGSRSGQKTGGE